MLNKILSFILVSFSAMFASSNIDADTDWTIDPENNVGRINKTSSENDLVRIYGTENVSRISIDNEDGIKEESTLLFPGTNKSVLIKWKDNFKKPAVITIEASTSDWRLNNGIKIGTPLQKVEELNTKPFKIRGFERVSPGTSVSWGEGKLSGKLKLNFDANEKLPIKDYALIASNKEFSSQNKIFHKINLKVKAIQIIWRT